MMKDILFRTVASVVLFVVPAVAAAAPALVAEVETGRVIYAEQATDPWFPASVTKLMTTYVVLGAIKEGRIGRDTALPVSARASAMAPSKMGFKPGLEVTVDNALKIIMVKSANDVAVTLAEGVGGSVEAFADMMNAAAQRLGMRESFFVNPNGLPDEGNRTSARDLAILGRALWREFPDDRGYFGIGAIKFGRRVMRNHNGLIGRYPGADGMKTGFICASGFNVVATATRGTKHLIVVVLGSRSANARTIKAAQLFDYGFADSGWGGAGTLDTLPVSFATAPRDLRDDVCGARRGHMGEEEAELPAAISAEAVADNPLFQLFGKPAPVVPSPTGQAAYTLGPRVAMEPIPVFVGRTAPAIATAGKRDKPRPAVVKPDNATAFAPTDQTAPAATGAAREAIQTATKPIGGKSVLRPGAGAKVPAAAAAKPAAAPAKAKPAALIDKPKPAAVHAKASAAPDTAHRPAEGKGEVTAKAHQAKPREAKAHEAKPREAKPREAKAQPAPKPKTAAAAKPKAVAAKPKTAAGR